MSRWRLVSRASWRHDEHETLFRSCLLDNVTPYTAIRFIIFFYVQNRGGPGCTVYRRRRRRRRQLSLRRRDHTSVSVQFITRARLSPVFGAKFVARPSGGSTGRAGTGNTHVKRCGVLGGSVFRFRSGDRKHNSTTKSKATRFHFVDYSHSALRDSVKLVPFRVIRVSCPSVEWSSALVIGPVGVRVRFITLSACVRVRRVPCLCA